MDEYRVAVIGHTRRGNYGHGLDVVWKSIPGCEIVGVADADPAGRQEALKRLEVKSGFADYQEMLDKLTPDIVSVAPRWLDQHHDMILACVERGIHVYCEKPFCRDLNEADAIVDACERNDAKLAIAFQTRYSPKLRVIRQLIDEGAIGKVVELRGRGKEDRRGGGEDLWVLGSHIFNLMHYIAGSPTWCSAQVNQHGSAAGLQDVVQGNEGLGPLTGDSINAMYGFDGDVTGFFGSHRNAGVGGTGRFGLEIVGTLGKIQLLTGVLPPAFLLEDPLWSPPRSNKAWLPITSAGVARPEPLHDGGLALGNQLACLDLLEAIEQDRLPEANVYEARSAVEMTMAVFASHMTRKMIHIPLKDRNHPLAQHA